MACFLRPCSWSARGSQLMPSARVFGPWPEHSNPAASCSQWSCALQAEAVDTFFFFACAPLTRGRCCTSDLIPPAFRRWDADGCMDAIFTGSVLRLHQDNLLDITVIHGDGTTTAAKGRRQHWLQRAQESEGRQGRRLLRPQLQCDRAVCFSPGNRNESPLLREALPKLRRIEIG